MEEYELKLSVTTHEGETPTEALYNLLIALQDTDRWQGTLQEAVEVYRKSNKHGSAGYYAGLDREYDIRLGSGDDAFFDLWHDARCAIAGTIERAVAQAVFDRAANEIKM